MIITFVLDLQCDSNPQVTYEFAHALSEKEREEIISVFNKMEDNGETEDKEISEIMEEVFENVGCGDGMEATEISYPKHIDEYIFL